MSVVCSGGEMWRGVGRLTMKWSGGSCIEWGNSAFSDSTVLAVGNVACWVHSVDTRAFRGQETSG